jgi:hypothetical protein
MNSAGTLGRNVVDPGVAPGGRLVSPAAWPARPVGSACCALAVVVGWMGCAKVSSSGGNPGAGAGNDIGASGGSVGQVGVDAGSLPDVGRADYVFVDRPGPQDYVTSDAPVAACATQSATAETLPLDIYVMMDSSSSMTDMTAAGPTKWEAVQTAMSSFFNDPASAGIGVGLQYFPQVQPNVMATCDKNTDCGAFGPCDKLRACAGPKTTSGTSCMANTDCKGGETCQEVGFCAALSTLTNISYCVPAGSACFPLGDACVGFAGNCHARDKCDIATYATPAVPIATLPGAAAALTTSLNMHMPDGLTPTGPALSAALQTAKARATANPGHKVAVLLVTDGLPTECTPVAVADVAAVAKTAATGTPAIPTFVIGVFGPDEAASATMNLNQLAAGGGTGTAVVINTNQNVTTALQAALTQIRTMAVACQYKIPLANVGAIDFGKVNVQLTGTGGLAATVGHVTTQAACDPTKGGWYYDVDPSTGGTPTSIIACDASCTQFRAVISARVDIVLGCQTITIL